MFESDIKSRYDEEKSLREAADQRLSKLTEQLQKEKQENERLQTELVQHNPLSEQHEICLAMSCLVKESKIISTI